MRTYRLDLSEQNLSRIYDKFSDDEKFETPLHEYLTEATKSFKYFSGYPLSEESSITITFEELLDVDSGETLPKTELRVVGRESVSPLVLITEDDDRLEITA